MTFNEQQYLDTVRSLDRSLNSTRSDATQPASIRTDPGISRCEVVRLNLTDNISLHLRNNNVEVRDRADQDFAPLAFGQLIGFISDSEKCPVRLYSYVPVDDALRKISYELDLQKEMVERLRKLAYFEIVMVIDDSGSMMTPVDGTQRTRWDELCSIVKMVLKIAVIFDSNGVDIYFINRTNSLTVKDPRDVDQAFATPPSGFTPLVPVLNEIFESELAHQGREKKLLVFVATDGEPTDEYGNPNVRELEHTMRENRQVETTYVSFLLCTDDPICVDYLSKWDKVMPNVDVTDDFHTERKKIRRYHGDNYRFSYGDYIVKAFVGAIDRGIDVINEPN